MEFSDQWRSLFPIPSIFPSPSLLSSSSSSSFGPLHLRPSAAASSLSLLPSLQIPPPLPSSYVLAAVNSFFDSSSSFLPSYSRSALAADVLSSFSPATDPIASNHLCALHSRSDLSAATLFFPSGDNSNFIGFLRLSFDGPEVKVSEIKIQNQGFKHPCHRITKISVVPASEQDVVMDTTGEIVAVDGFLIAATLYSVNWFRVESRVLEGEEVRVSVVPMAKQGFESLVVDARLSPHFPWQSVVLLESGELCWFDMEDKRSGKIRACVGFDGGDWLGCEFGGQPWIVYVACSSAALRVDMRANDGTEPKVLIRIDGDEDDRILAFCRSNFDDFHIAAVTETRLMLFDVRQPLVPILIWDHELNHPSYVSMFRLSELRPSEEFKRASDSGSVILVGSFWKDEFNVFIYGPRDGGAISCGSMLYAWELPYCFPLSCRYGSYDSLAKDDLAASFEWKQNGDVVVGFWIVPNDLLKVESEDGGFALIRLMLSGKLEMQKYHASGDKIRKKSNAKGEELPKADNSYVCPVAHIGKASSRRHPLRIGHLCEYMNGTLSSEVVMCKPQSSHLNRNFPADYLEQLKAIKLEPSNYMVSTFVNDATVPTSIFEITLRRVLCDLELGHSSMAFSKYYLLSRKNKEPAFNLLEVPKRLPHHRSIPFFVGDPLRISGKRSRKDSQALVGPVLPVPFLLLLQRMDHQKTSTCLNEEPYDDLLISECQSTLESIHPEISLADTGNFSDFGSSNGLQNEKSFFVYEKSVVCNASSSKGSWKMAGCGVKEEPQETKDTSLETETACEDEKFTTFVCGISDKAYHSYSGNEAAGLEMFYQLNPYRLDFDSPSVVFQPKEKEMYERLTKQSFKWLVDYKPHEEFCISSDIPKPPH